MSRLVVTPDAQYDDAGTVERAVGEDVLTFETFRVQLGDVVPEASLAACEALLVWHELQVDAALLARLPACRLIVRAGVGYENIDVKAAGAAGIPVCNTPEYGTGEVADHTLGLILALERGIVPLQEAIARDPVRGFDYRASPLPRRLRGRTLGLVGLGRTGTAVARRALPFGLRVIAYDPFHDGDGVEGVALFDDLDDLLRQADIVSLHTSLTELTRGLLGAGRLATMKPGAVLINTARGELVELDALTEALRSGRLRAAALDVLPVEPPDPPPPLLAAFAGREDWLRGRLIVTPHSAWSSLESSYDVRRMSAETVLAYLHRGKLHNCVNADWLKTVRTGAGGGGSVAD